MTQAGDIISFNEPRWGVTDKDSWRVTGVDSDGTVNLRPVKIVQMRCGIRIMLNTNDKRFKFPRATNRSRFLS
jgi:hypothetical protein